MLATRVWYVSFYIQTCKICTIGTLSSSMLVSHTLV